VVGPQADLHRAAQAFMVPEHASLDLYDSFPSQEPSETPRRCLLNAAGPEPREGGNARICKRSTCLDTVSFLFAHLDGRPSRPLARRFSRLDFCGLSGTPFPTAVPMFRPYVETLPSRQTQRLFETVINTWARPINRSVRDAQSCSNTSTRRPVIFANLIAS